MSKSTEASSKTAEKRGAAKADGYSRREREVMDVLYRLGRATAAQILNELPNPPSYTAMRTHLTILERKGHVRHQSDGTRYVYEPQVAREQMGKSAIKTLLQTFYDNSVESVVAALLSEEAVASEELDRLAQLIEKARKEGR